MGPDPTVSAVVVTYNSEDGIAETIQHLESVTAHLMMEILVVDNASQDQTAEVAERHLRRGRVIRLDENVGYGPGANVGIRHARGVRTLVMNDDVHPRPGCIDRLVGVLDSHPRAALVGPRMLYGDGTPAPSTRRHLPGWRDEVARLRDFLAADDRRNRFPDSTKPVPVALLIAACVLADTQLLWSIGGFNEECFIYGEDIDLARRLHTLGYQCVVVPDAVAVHHQEIAPDRRFGTREFMTRILEARDLYYRTWLRRPSRMLLNLYRAFGLSDQPYRVKFHLRRALYDGPTLKHLRAPGSLGACGHHWTSADS